MAPAGLLLAGGDVTLPEEKVVAGPLLVGANGVGVVGVVAGEQRAFIHHVPGRNCQNSQ